MNIESFMTACPYRIASKTSIDEALNIMELRGIRHLPVVGSSDDGDMNSGVVIGVVSKREVELSKFVCETTNFCPDLGDICVGEPFIVTIGTPVAKVAKEMANKKTDYALVIDADGNMVGIFTTTDVCRALCMVLESGAEA